jgi:hypothetical protein
MYSDSTASMVAILLSDSLGKRLWGGGFGWVGLGWVGLGWVEHGCGWTDGGVVGQNAANPSRPASKGISKLPPPTPTPLVHPPHLKSKAASISRKRLRSGKSPAGRWCSRWTWGGGVGVVGDYVM